MILRNNCQPAVLMLFYRRDDDSYIHSEETKSVQTSLVSFSLNPFSYILFESVRLPQTIINVYHILCSLRRLTMPVKESQSQSAVQEG